MSFSNYQIGHMCFCPFFLPCRSIAAHYIPNHLSLAVAFQYFSPTISFGSELAYHSQGNWYDQNIWVLYNLSKSNVSSVVDDPSWIFIAVLWHYSQCSDFPHIVRNLYTLTSRNQCTCIPLSFMSRDTGKTKTETLHKCLWEPNFLFINILWHTQQ